MIETFPIEGTPYVMAPYHDAKNLIRGQRAYVQVTYLKLEGERLLLPRQALVGLIVPTIFTKEQVAAQDIECAKMIPIGARLAYLGDVSETLDQAGKHEAAAVVRMEFKRLQGETTWMYALWMLESCDYRLLQRN